jgi:DnaK suppressor protein
MVDVQHYRQRLVQLEHQISARLQRELTHGREQVRDASRDAADESVAEAASEDFIEAELDATMLQEVEDAVKRIDDGTFGRCTVDGGPIDATTARCDAVDAVLLDA